MSWLQWISRMRPTRSWAFGPVHHSRTASLWMRCASYCESCAGRDSKIQMDVLSISAGTTTCTSASLRNVRTQNGQPLNAGFLWRAFGPLTITIEVDLLMNSHHFFHV